ncbi:alkaline phosphatase PhoX [Streptomyces sp. AC495_CC817]|uniref:alkaline phosphatase PhoX n=1 Tax=Streptomyces sp. AC495_CC817 TaxID=2823900 RepID=UPI001C27CB9E|nr:alkaline phosphatase PhoX [Streptomyces sp. AC495_CC817]
MPLTRRDFARRSAATTTGVALAGSVGALATAPNALASTDTDTATETDDTALDGDGTARGADRGGVGYGPLLPDPQGILALPAGFTYRIITYSGRTKLESGEFTPGKHDGTAAFPGPRGTTLLVNNHELKGPRANWQFPVPLTEGLVYDPAAAGGCTVVEVRPDGQVAEWVGIAGTSTNCAGGSTPWNTWLTCEENSDRAGVNGMTKDHGYVFEVDPCDRRANRAPKPLKFFGRYDHEAVVIDPRRGHAYLTEDAAGPNGLLYRWTPPKGFIYGPGRFRTLADDAGVLQAPRCYDSGGRFVDDLSRATRIGTVYGVDWIDVPDRDARSVAVRKQFADTEITRARKLEGMWWGDGGAYVVSSYARAESPGAAHDGQVWFYDPKRRTLTLKILLGVNPDPSADGALDGPDNITVSPYGGIVLAEDGEGVQHLFGATDSGRTYPIARNDLNIGTDEEPEYSEFAGVTFSPDGKTLYANIQAPGILLAITGPWKRQKR